MSNRSPHPTPAKQVKGNDMLKEYRSKKKEGSRSKQYQKNSSTENSASDDYESNPAQATANRLLSAFSNTKQSASKLTREHDTTTFEKTQSIQKDQYIRSNNQTPDVKRQIQIEEEEAFLEKSYAQHQKGIRTRLFSPTHLDEPNNDSKYSTPRTQIRNLIYTTTERLKQHRSQLKVYATGDPSNVNETDMEYYENVLNELADQLRRMGEEKDDLQQVSSGLGERIERLSRQKDETVERLTNELTIQREDYEMKLRLMKSELDSAIEYLSVEKKRNDDSSLGKIQKKLNFETGNEDKDLKIQQLQKEVDRLTIDLTDSQEQLDELSRDNEELRMKLRTAMSQMKSNHLDPSSSSKQVSTLEQQIDELTAQLSYKDVVIQSLHVKIEAFETTKPALEPSLDEHHTYQKLLFTPSPDEKDVHGLEGTPKPSSVGTPMEFNLTTSRLISDRSIIKVYMDNQMDLNQSDADYYENLVMKIVEQLETANAKMESLEAEKLQLDQLAKEQKIRIEDLMTSLDEKSKSLLELSKLRVPMYPLGSANKLLTNSLANSMDGAEVHDDLHALDLHLVVSRSLSGSKSPAATAHPLRDHEPGNVFTFSVPSPTHASYSLMNGEELRNLLIQRESQIKAQVSQLQSLQDALSEQKAANNVLKQQRNQLKSETDQLKQWHQQEIDALNRKVLELKLIHAVEGGGGGGGTSPKGVQQNGVELAAAKQRIEMLEEYIHDLQGKVNELQLQVDREDLSNLSMSRDEEDIKHLLPHSVDRSQESHPGASASASSLSLLQSNKKRLQRTDARVSELTQSLQNSVKLNEDLQIENEKLSTRYQQKSRQVDELNKEIQLFRENFQLKAQELDRVKLHEIKQDSNLRKKQIDIEDELESLKEKIIGKELQIQELNEQLKTLRSHWQDEKNQNESMRIFIEKCGKKDDENERLNNEMKKKIYQIETELFEKVDKNKQMLEEMNKLKLEVTESHRLFQQMEDKYRKFLKEKESESETVREEEERKSGEMREEMKELKRLNGELEDEIKRQKTKLLKNEKDVTAPLMESRRAQRALGDVTEAVVYFQTRMHKFETSLKNQVHSHVGKLEQRVDTLRDYITTEMKKAKPSEDVQLTNELYQRTLMETQQTLEEAVRRHEEDAVQIKKWRDMYLDAKDETGRLQNEVKYQTSSRLDATVRSLEASQVPLEDYEQLMQRLNEAEQRTMALSTEGAKSFARSARNIAYLEGECNRLRGLVDHFRVVNAKLTGDLKVANSEATRSRSLEYRLKMMADDEAILQERLKLAESLLVNKEQELLTNFSQGRDNDENRSQLFDKELGKLTENLKSSKDRINQLAKENEALKEALHHANRRYDEESGVWMEKIRGLERENASVLDALSLTKTDMKTLRLTAQEKEQRQIEENYRINALENEVRTLKDLHARVVNELNLDNTEKQNRIRSLEATLSALKSKMHDIESSFIQRDEEISSTLLKRVNTENELRQLRSVLDQRGMELNQVTIQRDQIQYQLHATDEAFQKLKDLHANTEEKLQKKSKKLQETEVAQSAMQEELKSIRHELKENQQLIISTRNALIEAETSFQTLQSRHSTVQANEQLYRTQYESMKETNDALKAQVKDLLDRLNVHTNELTLNRNVTEQHEGKHKELEQHVNALEKKLSRAKLLCNLIEKSEMSLVQQVREVILSLDTIEVSERNPSLEVSRSAMDLFSSPIASNRSEVTMPESPFQAELVAFIDSGVGMDTLSSSVDEILPNTLMLTKLNQMNQTLRTRIEDFVKNYNELKTSKVKAMKEINELKKTITNNVEKIADLTTNRDQLVINLEKMEDQMNDLKDKLTSSEFNNDILSGNLDTISQRINLIIRDLNGSLLEALSNANDVVAGIIPIEIESVSSFSEGNSMVIFDDSSSNNALNSVARLRNDSTSFSLLTTTMKEVERVTSYMNSIITSLVGEVKRLKTLSEKQNRTWDQRDKAREVELDGHLRRINELEINLEKERNAALVITQELHSNKRELERVNDRLTEMTSTAEVTEAELKVCVENNAELQKALGDSDALCQEQRLKLRSQQSELEGKNAEVMVANQQVEALRNKVFETELLQEKVQSSLIRVTAEKEVLDGIRRSLDSELERSRLELMNLRDSNKGQEEEKRATFEIEKLLAALSTTMDQIQTLPTNRSSKSEMSSSLNKEVALMSTNSTALSMHLSHRDESLSVRVDDAVKRLSQFRIWTRDEARSRSLLENQFELVNEELLTLQKVHDEAQVQLKRCMSTLSERERELKVRTEEWDQLRLDKQKLEEELRRLHHEGVRSLEEVEDERRVKQRLTVELQLKENELVHALAELEAKQHKIARQQDQIESIQHQLEEAQHEIEVRSEQIRTAKINSDRMLTTLERLEKASEVEKADRLALERRVVEAESQVGLNASMKAKLQEMESNCLRLQDELHQVLQVKATSEEMAQTTQKEVQHYRKKLDALESRFAAIMQEKTSYADEINETRKKIMAAKEQAEAERMQRLITEATVEALRRGGEEKKSIVGEFSAKAIELEQKQLQAEEEKRSLRSKIMELKLSYEQQETQRQAEESGRKKLEKDIMLLKNTLAQRNQELSNSTNYSSLLRTEGRQARKQVMEVINQIKELMNVLRLDTVGSGVDTESRSAPRKVDLMPSQVEGLDRENRLDGSLGLAEALGLNELTLTLDSLREVMNGLRSTPKRQNFELICRNLEAENANLLKELQAAEAKKTELTNQYKEQIQSMQVQVTELRRSDSKNPHLIHQISTLEGALKQEREKKEAIQQELDQLKNRMSSLNQEAMLVNHKRSIETTLQSELHTARSEIETLQTELNAMRRELMAISHHRTVLRDVVEQLEKNLMNRLDAIVETHSATHTRDVYDVVDGPDGSIEEGLEIVRKQLLRYKVRAAAMDELAGMYRTSVLALYADGASYGAAQYGWQPYDESEGGANRGLPLIGVGWIEREMNIVKHTYEDEIRMLDSEVSDLRSKLRQSNSYIVELRKRFEDNMKSIYRTGKVHASEGIIQQFEQMRISLETAQSEVVTLQQELSIERTQARQRHSRLVDEFTKALQIRDAALAGLKRLEGYCVEKGLDIKRLAIYETLRTEVNASSSDVMKQSMASSYGQNQSGPVQGNQSGVMDTLVRGLVEADHELLEAERRSKSRDHHDNRMYSSGIEMHSNVPTTISPNRMHENDNAKASRRWNEREQSSQSSSWVEESNRQSGVTKNERYGGGGGRSSGTAVLRVKKSSNR